MVSNLSNISGRYIDFSSVIIKKKEILFFKSENYIFNVIILLRKLQFFYPEAACNKESKENLDKANPMS